MEKDTLIQLWEDLMENACDEAAAGLICDQFRFLHYVETKWPTAVPAKYADTDKVMKEGRWINLREVLMVLLDDEGGTKLQIAGTWSDGRTT
jgi:hypothetical protein